MVQIGNIHIGKANSAVPPKINIMEASLLWDFTIARYLCVEETQIYHHYAHDPEFKTLLDFGVGFLKSQADELEKQMNLYKLPLPKRPPQSVSSGTDNIAFTDQYMFSQVFKGCQNYIEYLARICKTVITNDALRQVMVELLTDELTLFDKLVKFGKLKGWMEAPPVFHPE